jgi:translation initiation factor IF-2
MSDNNDKKSTEMKLAAPKKLQLTKTVESGQVQQTFSRGRSKSVTVEVKKTRTFSRDTAGKMREDRKKTSIATAGAEELANLTEEELGGLTEQERNKRLEVLEKAKVRSDELAEVEKVRKAEEDAKAAEEAENAPEPEEETATEETSDDSTNKSTESTDVQKDTATKEKPKKKLLTVIEDAPMPPPEDEFGHAKLKAPEKGSAARVDPLRKPAKVVDNSSKRKTKLTISNFNQEERMQSLAAVKRRRQKVKRQIEGHHGEAEKTVREIILPETIQVGELANRMAVRVTDVVKELMKLGIMATPNQVLDVDTAELIVSELGHTFKRVSDADVEDILIKEIVDASSMAHRAPVVTIMGHVDHGKTSLLDALRNTNVTDGEAGGITQHIGAYQITTDSGEKVTFLDTPGHAAFTAMRKRGANVTDIVVLIVAADDGIMPQTIEAINHSKAAEVPIIVAINKIDKPDADTQKVKNELLQHELVPEDLGGDVQVVEVSAKAGTNLDILLETILLQAEMLELKASETIRSGGSVIESEIDKARGIVATLLVQHGTLRKGDIVVAGASFGKVKTLTNDAGRKIDTAGPSLPVEVLGLNECPNAGDEFAVCQTEKQARDIVEFRKKRDLDSRSAAKVGATDTESLNLLFESATGDKKELRLIIKGDVQGSVEAIIGTLEKLNNEEVTVKVVHSAAGGVTESDVQLAAAVGANILAFNVRASIQTKQLAQEESIDIRYYSIIYNLIDDMKAAIGGMMSPLLRESFIGNALIQQVFKMSKYGKVGGCLVKEGIVKRGAGVRLIRDDVVIHEGKLKTLKRFKEDVQEAREGIECGMQFENYEDIKDGDFIECFEIVEEQRVID